MSKQKDQFITLLGELFQLNQPELDFGLYRILHARSAQIKAFIDTELGSEIDAHFASQSQSNAHDALEAARVRVTDALGEDAFLPTGELKPEYRGTKVGKEFEVAQQQARDGGGVLADDAQVYEHLYRFFSRYYDKGDFMSKRYFVAENDSRAAPYAVPYDGREVMLHWANKDQYYIKSSEALSNFTFDLSTAQAKEQDRQVGLDLETEAVAGPLKVHFRLAAAAEGEHNNVKEGQERFFIIAAEPLRLETSDQGLPELVVQFEYRPDPDKTGQAGTWQQKRLTEAEKIVRRQLSALVAQYPEARAFEQPLFALAPTEKQPTRTLLAKYLGQFTARNTMDYFIHKNLGGFLRRELDFYIKNEIIRLDDIEAADAPRVDEYLKKLRVLRKIAHSIIRLIAQIEEFNKKLWTKKKFVTETNYCITLDLIPQSLYQEISENETQRKQWVELFRIDKIKNQDGRHNYSEPLTIEFLRENRYLTLDTSFFSSKFKERLISSIQDLDEKTDGLLINSENFQALNLISKRYEKQIKTIYIDPPYNTGDDGFPYKDGYKKSSWASMINDRISSSLPLLKESATFYCSIDDREFESAFSIISSTFGRDNFLANLVWEKVHTRKNSAKYFSLQHEYIISFAKNKQKWHRNLLARENTNAYSNPDNDPKGDWKSDPITANNYYSADYKIEKPNGIILERPKDRYWAFSEETWKTFVKEKRVLWGEGDSYPLVKRYLNEVQDGLVPVTLIQLKEYIGGVPSTVLKRTDFADTATSKGEQKSLFGEEELIKYTKPTKLISGVLQVSLCKNEQALDFFAGSGTTGHAIINMNREDDGKRKYVLIEMGNYFDGVLKPRIQKAIYSKDWRDGHPASQDGLSHCFKYIRLESFEDTLNNLKILENSNLKTSKPESKNIAREYILKYWLEFETAGSPSLLNVREFTDPTSYKLKVKQAGSDAQVEKTIDLVETFNWLIGLHVAHLDQPRRYAIELVRETDPELPQDQDTRWRATSIKERDDGEFWFRTVEGHILSGPGNDLSSERVLVIWRKLTGDSGRDQAALEAWLNKNDINPRDSDYKHIYINGNHALPSDGDAATRVRLIEETFAQRMWEDA